MLIRSRLKYIYIWPPCCKSYIDGIEAIQNKFLHLYVFKLCEHFYYNNVSHYDDIDILANCRKFSDLM